MSGAGDELRPLEEQARLFLERRTDVERWRDASATYGCRNPERAQQAARLIPRDASVLDLGAGSMILRGLLRSDCRYTPVDVIERGAGCLVADLNAGEFPQGQWDYVAALGLFEYLADVPAVLQRCADAARQGLVFSYAYYFWKDRGVAPLEPPVERLKFGWRNAYSALGLIDLVQQAGFEPLIVHRIVDNQILALALRR